MELKPWMLNFFDVNDQEEPIFWCKPCSEEKGFKVFVVMRNTKNNEKQIQDFERKHFWCGQDRAFNVRWLELQYGQDLDDKQKIFIHQCMDEGFERDRILELLKKPLGQMPTQSLLRIGV